MTAKPRIAIDAMGGDEGISVMVAGAAIAAERDPECRFLLVGEESRIAAALAEHSALRQASDIVHSASVVAADAKSQVARRATGTSMRMAIDAVKSGDADAAISAGSTPALVAIAKLALRTLPGIDRPALSALLPTLRDSDVVMLDLGANTECDSGNLIQFAAMGAAYSRIMYGFDRPRVALLNIGTEDNKGTGALQDAAQTLRDSVQLSMEFLGFTESDKISRGEFDVIVSDGFSGNVALKAIEGTARFVGDLLRRSFESSLRSRFGYMISKPATMLLRDHLDPNNHNGAVLLGLNGVVVKSHGSANARGVANAIRVTKRLVEDNILGRIAEDIAKIGTGPAPIAAAAG